MEAAASSTATLSYLATKCASLLEDWHSYTFVDQAERRARIAAMLGRLLLQEPGPDAADLVAA